MSWTFYLMAWVESRHCSVYFPPFLSACLATDMAVRSAWATSYCLASCFLHVFQSTVLLMGLKHSSMNCLLLSDENVRPVTILGLNTEKKGVLSFPFQNLCSPSCTVNTDCLMQILLRLREPLLSLSRSAVNEHIFKDRKLNEPEARTSNHKNMACVFFSPLRQGTQYFLLQS